MKKRILLTTIGSLGDLHPYIAIARGLQARGHQAIIATSERYRPNVESEGIAFRPMRPNLPPPQVYPAFIRRVMDRRMGTQRIVRELLMPIVRESYEDLLAAADECDLLVSHPITFAARLVAEKTGVPWASSVLAPISLFSAHDPPVLPVISALGKVPFLDDRFYRIFFGFIRCMTRSWAKPWYRLRAEIGLPPTPDNPIFEGQHSPSRVLGLFSPLLAAPQPDWPPQTIVTGFAFYDRPGLSPGLARFLDEGRSPIVFTLGSSAVMDAGRFYEHSAAAAKLLGRRAVLLIGDLAANRPASLPEGVAAFDYAPFSELFPRAAAIVHQGGIGTCGQAMRSGRPMLIMPYAHDQPDNAERLRRLGIARTLPRRQYSPQRVAAELEHLLKPQYGHRAAEVGEQVRREGGVRAACDALARN